LTSRSLKSCSVQKHGSSPESFSSDFFPKFYNVYRKVRAGGYGCALAAVLSSLISHEIYHNSPAEAVLVQVQAQKKNEALILGSFYRSPWTPATSIIQALSEVKTDGVVWLLGDLNLPDINWKDKTMITRHYPSKINKLFLEKVTDMGLLQVNCKPTIGQHIIDLFLTNRPSLITKSSTIPPLV
jgi:hypothetical protein